MQQVIAYKTEPEWKYHILIKNTQKTIAYYKKSDILWIQSLGKDVSLWRFKLF